MFFRRTGNPPVQTFFNKLLVGAAAGRMDYSSIWCEQEDDILAEIDGKLFDSYQVKTQKPELGPWTCTDDAFVSAVSVFLGLDKRFPNQFRHFHFVSNTECLESKAKDKVHLCPRPLADEAATCLNAEFLSVSHAKGFQALLQKTGGDSAALFQVLRRLKFVKGPSRESFLAELAQNHLRELKWCQFSQPRLERLVFSLLGAVDAASSLSSQDPARHHACCTGDVKIDPQLQAKRITAEDFILKTREFANPPFTYLPSLTTGPLAKTSPGLNRFKQKLHRGGLDHYADLLRNQMLSAEEVFLELAERGPEGAAMITQIENVVRAECDAAHLRASQHKKPFGQRMLIDVQDRLERVTKTEPQKVGGQAHEALMGMAGLLTEHCPVWWSDKFDLEMPS